MNNLSIVSYMPIFTGKRLEFVGVKLSQSEKSAFEKIASDHDRAMSYVVRELALRGLVQYLKDNKIKTTNEEVEFIIKNLNLNVESLVKNKLRPMNQTLTTGELGDVKAGKKLQKKVR